MTAYNRIEDVPLFRYGLVMADPPWEFDHWGEPNERSAGGHYQTMPMDEIMALPVDQLLAPHAFVWLWITPSLAHHADRIMEAWKIKPVTMGFWVKVQKGDPAKPKMGLGHVLRECGEPYYIGKVGNPQIHDRGIPSVIMERKREHSRKPEGGYTNAERLAPRGAWLLDLFSRQERPGWDRMGNQHDKFEAVA